MQAARRRAYLEAMGIESWALRSSPAASAPEPAIEAALPEEPVEEAEIVQARGPAAAREVPADWNGLRCAVRDCTACELAQTRTQAVFGVGPENAPLMVVGEGPGADEDARGEPFVGRAGKLLDQMLAAIGYSRSENVFIANVVKCRPPGNRDPKPDEAEACRPFLEQQIRLVKPRLIVALGRVAAQRLLASDLPLSKLRSELHRYGPEQTPLLITYHPAYLLRSPREKAKSWADLKRVARFLEDGGS